MVSILTLFSREDSSSKKAKACVDLKLEHLHISDSGPSLGEGDFTDEVTTVLSGSETCSVSASEGGGACT